jgi:hypothetical protein
MSSSEDESNKTKTKSTRPKTTQDVKYIPSTCSHFTPYWSLGSYFSLVPQTILPSSVFPQITPTAHSNPNKHLIQAAKSQINWLMQHIDKPIKLPESKRNYKPFVRPPPETMRNVQGSSAGAGSGEFHVYRSLRRKEMARLNMLEREAKKVYIFFSSF